MMDTPSLSDVSPIIELIEAQAQAEGLLFAPPAFLSKSGARVEWVGGAVLHILPRLPVNGFWNFVVGFGLRLPATLTMLEAIISRFQGAAAPNIAIQLSPYAQPPELVGWLKARNFTPTAGAIKFYRGTSPLAVPSHSFRVVAIDESLADIFATIAHTSFNLPSVMRPWIASPVTQAGWRHYIAFDGDVPIATAALFVRNEAAWLGFASTLPPYRRRGVQSILLAQRIHDALALGCRWLTTEADPDLPGQPNPSSHNILRAGFQIAYQRTDYVYHF